MAYFEGTTSFKELLEYANVSDEIKIKLLECETEKELYDVCKKLDLYKF
ncbi:MAG: hypothetical protein K5989_08170 [Lachnospiraceae bacterium]|nr:hypothetical protein [Lachnospiraceae bacterium]